jgi:lysozyme family protein
VSTRTFDQAFKEVVGMEGGFGADPEDRGNWTGGKIGIGLLKGTKYGISAASYPNLDIRNISLDQAKGIYFIDFWRALHLDEVPNDPIAIEIFDTSVNCGKAAATRIVQKSLNFLGDKLALDGVLGPNTLTHIQHWCQKDPESFHKALNGYQFVHYAALVEAGAPYGRGWLKRIQSYRR